MLRYSYIAIDQSGRKQRGVAEAESSFALARQLRQAGLSIISATLLDAQAATVSAPPKRQSLFTPKIKSEDIVIFYRQLATMVEAGVQLTDSLGVLSEQIQQSEFRAVVTDVREKLQAGSSFSAALALHPHIFPLISVSMVRVAEAGGNLGKILNQLAQYIEQKDQIDRKIKSAMSYPRFILIFFLLVVGAVVFGLVPKFQEIFASFGAQLPGPTLLILNVSHFLKSHFLVELFLFAGLIGGFKLLKKHPQGKRFLHRLYFKIPVVGQLLLKSIAARFSQTLGTLVSNGVQLVDALQIAGDTTNNIIIQEAIQNVKKAVTGGSSLAAALAQYPIFPPMMIKMIAVGEESGALDKMLGKVAEFNERQLNTTIDSLTAIIEPALMIGLGVLALIVVIALYLPIFQMSGAISG